MDQHLGDDDNDGAETRMEAPVMKELLGSRMKCTLDDGRTVSGTFVCLDRL